MTAFLLALILCLLLEQGDRAQIMAIEMGEQAGGVATTTIFSACAAVIVACGVSAWGGAFLGDVMRPEAQLLFFAFCLIIGGGGLLASALVAPAPLTRKRAGSSYDPLQFIVAQLTSRSSFAIVGVASLTEAPALSFMGALLGGAIALFAALRVGLAYHQAVPRRLIARAGGATLLLAGLICALKALGRL